MPKKLNNIFVCDSCGGEHQKWSGKCLYCGSWNSLKEIRGINQINSVESAEVIKLSQVEDDSGERLASGLEDFDLVCGGGIVKGSISLLGGAPGIGKSTLLWQISTFVKGEVIYIAAEESPSQIKIRSKRLGMVSDNILLVDNNEVNAWMKVVEKIKPKMLIVDSIQTVYDSSIAGTPGSIMQIKSCAIKIINLAKKLSIPTVIVGHITKDGEVAGPKMLEHLVDSVFYLEGEGNSRNRFLRSSKNRFGPTDEMGVFVLGEKGLSEADDFGRILPDKTLPIGVARTCTIEGSRTYFIELQSLTEKTSFGFPRRTTSGYDLNRLQILIAVLAKVTKVNLNEMNVFVSTADNYKIKNAINDLSMIASLVSSYCNKPLSGEDIYLGEVDLSGFIRVRQDLSRMKKSALKMGYKVKDYQGMKLSDFVNKLF